jgi:hypothetical protein
MGDVNTTSIYSLMSDNNQFTLRKIHESIYLVTFPTQYDVNMHFLRPQEFYESANPNFRGETFSLFEFMRWYSVERDGHNGTFTYTSDWSGFNTPSWVLEELYCHKTIPDENEYDITMRAIYTTVRRLEGPKQKFYIVGCVEKGSALDHELAHGLFYIDDEYREEQMKNIDDMVAKRGVEVKDAIFKGLLEEGYCADMLNDELQAYMSTYLTDRIQVNLCELDIDSPRKITWLCKPFVETFERYAVKADMPWRTVKKRSARKKGEKKDAA